ncbi:sulfur globule family protein [Yinghuangia soli]|uniref:Sulfur globule family protein n=1 Tax=Yinghuangia soli TaxID=2908204 RepID=A0AA41Q8J7_9ACTN|nr:sulfur globule family protein [Yinghuangia soli]MCF2532344.1 sulfur globule family protein [Yinghuangia soli]
MTTPNPPYAAIPPAQPGPPPGPAPIPLAADAVPPGTRAWTQQAARRWTALRIPLWTMPYPAIAAMVVGLIVLGESDMPVACDQGGSDTCGPEWQILVLLWGLVIGIWGLFAVPTVAILALGVALGITINLRPQDAADLGQSWGWWLLTAGLLGGMTLSGIRIARGRAQRKAAAEAAGPMVHPVPAAAGARSVQRAVVRLVFGGCGALLAVLCTIGTIDAYRDDDRHAARAEVKSATVVDTDVDTARILVDGETEERTVDTWDYDYEDGERVDVLIDGDWARLEAETFAPIAWLFGLGISGAVAFVLIPEAARVRLRAARLNPGKPPVSTLRVQVVFVHASHVAVYAADDQVRVDPLFKADVAWWPTPPGMFSVSVPSSVPSSVPASAPVPVPVVSEPSTPESESESASEPSLGADAVETAAAGVELTKQPPAEPVQPAAPAVPAVPAGVYGQPYAYGQFAPAGAPQMYGPPMYGMPMYGAPWMAPAPRACEAVLFGTPYAGAEFVLLIARDGDTPVVARSKRVIRPLAAKHPVLKPYPAA